MGIRLNEKDLAVLLDSARFRGLTAETIRHIHFNDSTYAWKRLNALHENNYLGRKYYYEVKKTASGINHAQRIAALYFPTPKGLKTVNYSIDPRYVVPMDHRLDVHYVLSRLYNNIPELLPKRDAQEKYPLKNYMPVTCMVPDQHKPFFISIIGNNKAHKEESKLVKFVETGYFPGTYIIVSSKFPGEKLLLTDSHYIHHDLAPEVIPNMARGRNDYLDFFITKFAKGVVGHQDLFTMVDVQNRGVCHFAELFTGSTRLMRSLRRPLPKTYIYLDRIRHIQGIKLEHGSFHAFSREKQKFYRVYLEDDKIKHRLIE